MINLKEIERQKNERVKHIRRDALKKAKKIAIMLKNKYGAKEVILFGSLSRKEFIHERTDIDLLVKGINLEDLLIAGIDAWKIALPFDVDIIPEEKAEHFIIKIAKKEGIRL